MVSQPTVFVVDDDQPVRESLEALARSVGLTIETFPTAQSFIQNYNPLRPGCLILDVRMPGMSGLELQRHLKERGIHTPVIIMTGHGDVPIAVRALKDGAFEFLEKPFNKQRLLGRIRAAFEHDAERRRQDENTTAIFNRLQTLTHREKMVMDLIVAGMLSKEIAAELGISKKTVDIHRSRVMHKLGVQCLPRLMELVLAARNASLPTGETSYAN